MFQPNVHLPMPGRTELLFHRSGRKLVDGAEVNVWLPVAKCVGDVQPSGSPQRILGHADIYESAYKIVIPQWPQLGETYDIRSKDRCVLNGKVAEVVDSDSWGTQITLQVATMSNVKPADMGFYIGTP